MSFLRSLLLIAAGALLASLTGCGGGGISSPPPPPQASNVLAYLHRDGESLSYEIKVLKSDGTTATIGSPDSYISVVLAPNGQKVLFSYYDPLSGYQIATMNLDSTGRTVLTTSGSGNLYPQYTPDGSRIVYQVSGNLAVMNADGSNSITITNSLEYCFPTTNGSIIAVGKFSSGQQGLATMNMDGSNQQIIVSTIYPIYPVFGADAGKIIFSNSNGASENVYSVSTNGSNLLQLTNSAENWDPVVAGNKIYFDYIPPTIQNPTTDSNQLYSISLDGSNLTAVTSDPLYDGFKTFNGLCLSP